MFVLRGVCGGNLQLLVLGPMLFRIFIGELKIQVKFLLIKFVDDKRN